MNKIYTDYVFCIPGKTFSAKFLISWSNSLLYLEKESIDFIYTNLYSFSAAMTRNDMIRNFPGEKNSKNILPFNNKLEPKKVIFIDDDITWSIEDLKKILYSDKDIICGFYKMESTNLYGENNLAAFKNNKNILEYEIENETNLIELDSCGFGFIAINFKVFKNMTFPWFETFDLVDPKNNEVINISEDVDFCRKATNLGYKIYGDPTIKLGHQKLKTLDFK